MNNREKDCLIEMLMENLNRGFSVKRFCQSCGISRGTFYSRYGNHQKLFTEVLLLDLRKAFGNSKNFTLDEIAEKIVLQVQVNWKIYLRLYHLTTPEEHAEMKERIIEELKNLLEGLIDDKNDIGQRRLRLICHTIYNHLFGLILHGFDTEVYDAKSQLIRQFDELEGKRCARCKRN